MGGEAGEGATEGIFARAARGAEPAARAGIVAAEGFRPPPL